MKLIYPSVDCGPTGYLLDATTTTIDPEVGKARLGVLLLREAGGI